MTAGGGLGGSGRLGSAQIISCRACASRLKRALRDPTSRRSLSRLLLRSLLSSADRVRNCHKFPPMNPLMREEVITTRPTSYESVRQASKGAMQCAIRFVPGSPCRGCSTAIRSLEEKERETRKLRIGRAVITSLISSRPLMGPPDLALNRVARRENKLNHRLVNPSLLPSERQSSRWLFVCSRGHVNREQNCKGRQRAREEGRGGYGNFSRACFLAKG